ncbi:MAG: hypothetical protein ACI92E_002450 [Oceanicoccus sp.]|jgi:hypothetical protein
MTTLKILAGPSAYHHIQKNGLSPSAVSAIFGASGAAKWLAIYGLDKAIFGEWLTDSQQSIDLFGTSVGAFKLAAAAQIDPAAAMTKLAEAYIHQSYQGKDVTEQVSIETMKILDAFLNEHGAGEILANTRFNYHCSSVRCLGMLGSANVSLQKIGMLKAFLLSLRGRNFHRNTFERTIFYSGSPNNHFLGRDQIKTHRVALTKENLRTAILSSGSIPIIMPGIENIVGAPRGVYRDGGLLDYHAVPSNVSDIRDGLVLYPHFYTYLIEGWFNKFTPWRKVNAQRLDNTILIGPSDSFVMSLPGKKIPDRNDFVQFKNNEKERMRRWTSAKDRSIELGEEFIQLARSGDIANHITCL